MDFNQGAIVVIGTLFTGLCTLAKLMRDSQQERINALEAAYSNALAENDTLRHQVNQLEHSAGEYSVWRNCNAQQCPFKPNLNPKL